MAILEWVGILCLMRDHKSPFDSQRAWLASLSYLSKLNWKMHWVPSAESEWVAVDESIDVVD